MCLVEDIPLIMRTIYRLYGVIQFSCKITSNSFLPYLYRLYCTPVVVIYGYCCYSWLPFFISEADTNPAQVDLIISIIGIPSALTSLLIFVLRSNQLQILLLKLQTMTPKSQKRHKNWLKILVLVTVVLHFVYFPIFPVFSVASVYYFMPTAIGLCDHLFLDDILQSISMEFSRINQELNKLATEQLYYPEMCAIDQLTLRHSDLVTLAIDINKLFDIFTISSMSTWLVYAVDCVYFLVHSLVVENTNSGKVVLITFTALDGLLFVLWLSMMVRMYSRTQREVKHCLCGSFRCYFFVGQSNSGVGTRCMESMLQKNQWGQENSAWSRTDFG